MVEERIRGRWMMANGIAKEGTITRNYRLMWLTLMQKILTKQFAVEIFNSLENQEFLPKEQTG